MNSNEIITYQKSHWERLKDSKVIRRKLPYSALFLVGIGVAIYFGEWFGALGWLYAFLYYFLWVLGEDIEATQKDVIELGDTLSKAYREGIDARDELLEKYSTSISEFHANRKLLEKYRKTC